MEWKGQREAYWRRQHRQVTSIGLEASYNLWPVCLKICGLMPTHLSKDVPVDFVNTFMATYHTMVLGVLRARAGRVDTQLFREPSKTCRTIQYPYMQLYGPLPRPDDRTPFGVGPMTNNECRWDQGFCQDLVCWSTSCSRSRGRSCQWTLSVTVDAPCECPHKPSTEPPACTSGDGEDDTQDSLQHTLLPVALAPVFAAVAAPCVPLSP